MLSLIVVFAFSFVGCGTGDNKREAELEKKIEQLKQQVAELEEKATNDSVSTSHNISSTDKPNNVEATDATDNHVPSDTVESLTKDVKKVIQKADAATPSGNADEKKTKFFELKDELDLVEDRLDDYDDYIESQYKRGSLSYEDYKKQERSLSDLEDKLDVSEDKLERTFGIYD